MVSLSESEADESVIRSLDLILEFDGMFRLAVLFVGAAFLVLFVADTVRACPGPRFCAAVVEALGVEAVLLARSCGVVEVKRLAPGGTGVEIPLMLSGVRFPACCC